VPGANTAISPFTMYRAQWPADTCACRIVQMTAYGLADLWGLVGPWTVAG
jgi:hypothetical protein